MAGTIVPATPLLDGHGSGVGVFRHCATLTFAGSQTIRSPGELRACRVIQAVIWGSRHESR
jgi:hypothetical protein